MTTKKLIIRISYCFLLFLLGIWFPKLRAYADCPFPAQQDASISATCTISTTTGIDVAANETSTTNTGKVTIGADTTINNGGTLTTGSLQIVSGTTISIQDGFMHRIPHATVMLMILIISIPQQAQENAVCFFLKA
jgi:hypothetical protein